jgi:hypothetical protein
MKLTDQEKRITGIARSRLEPVRPGKGMPMVSTCYIYKVNGSTVPWAAYCRPRFDWLIREASQHNINLSALGKPGSIVPQKTCRKVAAMLREILESVDYEPNLGGKTILQADIAFWSSCGGLRVHEWGYLFQDY